MLDELDAAAPRRGRARRGGRAGAARRVRHGGGGARARRRWRRCRRDLVVTLREGTTPALTRALRAGTLDLAVLAQTPPFRPPDAESPAARAHDALRARAGRRRRRRGTRSPARRAVEVGELAGQVWVASRSDAGESLLGVWPGLAERPDVRYVVRDWLAKLQLVAAGLAITTLAPVALDVLPDGVRAVAVRGEPQETAAPGPRPRAGPARRQGGRGRRRAGQRGEGLTPGAPQPRSRRRATWRSSAARRSSHAPPTEVIHEMASPSGAGVGR